MAKTSGIFTVSEGDAYIAPELLETGARKAIKLQLDEFAFVAYTADREIMRRELPVLGHDEIQFLVVAGAEARARWLRRALDLAKTKVPPTPAEVDELARLRNAYDEFVSAFEAARRVVERGYSKLG
jgi:hypothetical protein